MYIIETVIVSLNYLSAQQIIRLETKNTSFGSFWTIIERFSINWYISDRTRIESVIIIKTRMLNNKKYDIFYK